MEIAGVDIEQNPLIKIIVDEYGYTGSIIFKFIIGLLFIIVLYEGYQRGSLKNKKLTGFLLFTVILIYFLITLLHFFNIIYYNLQYTIYLPTKDVYF